jgi:hypothetical protein
MNRENENQPQGKIRVRLPLELLERLRAASNAWGLSQGEVVARSLRAYWRLVREGRRPPLELHRQDNCGARESAVFVAPMDVDLFVGLESKDVRAVIGWRLSTYEAKPAPPLQIDPRDAEVPYEIVEGVT